jgi:hypothetical protein
MAKYYVFHGTTDSAQMITDHKSGKKLPEHPVGSWVFAKEIDIQPGQHLIGASTDTIIANVAKDGYHRWPEPKPDAQQDSPCQPDLRARSAPPT